MTDIESIDEQVKSFHEQLKHASFIDLYQANEDARELVRALATAPTSKATGAALIDWAAAHAEAHAYRDFIVTTAIAQYALYIAFEAGGFETRGPDGHLSKLGMIQLTCRTLGITLKETL